MKRSGSRATPPTPRRDVTRRDAPRHTRAPGDRSPLIARLGRRRARGGSRSSRRRGSGDGVYSRPPRTRGSAIRRRRYSVESSPLSLVFSDISPRYRWPRTCTTAGPARMKIPPPRGFIGRCGERRRRENTVNDDATRALSPKDALTRTSTYAQPTLDRLLLKTEHLPSLSGWPGRLARL